MIGYQEYGDAGGIPLVLLPPGIENGTYWYQLSDCFKGYRMLCFDYPGRGTSQMLHESSVKDIARLIQECLIGLGIHYFDIFGYSLGSAIGIELLRLTKETNVTVGSVTLLAPGSYLTRYRLVINILFKPAQYSALLRNTYARIVRRSGVFKHFPDNNFDTLNRQWLSIVNWDVPNDFTTTVPTKLVYLENDKISNKYSFESIQRIFPQANIYRFPYGHFLTEAELRTIMEKLHAIS